MSLKSPFLSRCAPSSPLFPQYDGGNISSLIRGLFCVCVRTTFHPTFAGISLLWICLFFKAGPCWSVFKLYPPPYRTPPNQHSSIESHALSTLSSLVFTGQPLWTVTTSEPPPLASPSFLSFTFCFPPHHTNGRSHLMNTLTFPSPKLEAVSDRDVRVSLNCSSLGLVLLSSLSSLTLTTKHSPLLIRLFLTLHS